MSGGALPGHLYGVGVGPGDPDLMTLRAAALVSSADVVAYHRAAHRDSTARAIASGQLRDDVLEEELVYPVTTGTTDHDGGYYGALAEFYLECAHRLRGHLAAGRSVVVLAEGDPLFYGSFMYVHDVLREEFPTEVVPGVTSVSAASAAAGTGLSRHEDTLTVLPGTLPVPELARRLADTDAAVVMKLGRTFAAVREALRQAGRLEEAVYVERASAPGQRVLPAAEVDPGTVPYMSLVVVPGADLRADAAGRAAADGPLSTAPDGSPSAGCASSVQVSATGTVHVVGLGPGPQRWVTPEAGEVLAAVAHVVGYAPYVARVPQRAGLTRHASGNTVEVERAREALELALAGEQVAVVSGGDAGVFGMAAAVFEAAEDPRYGSVPVHVVPGVTAAHAAAALAGALLGADHALISLSDRLKPWEVLLERLTAAVRADLVVALYNPRSRSRPGQLAAALEAVREVVGPDRVLVVARDVGRAGEQLRVTTVGALDPETVDMRCLVVIGASRTRVTPAGRVWTPRSVRPLPSTSPSSI
ncbi:precorrin-2 C(20)-methyltransferase [Phycicoccus endophyticus]|uniref:Precorrin-2 C(20)-methyltransferase n=1 Tax=Phycicoccus endophyticus TaxID=1690220 RepID=A0A7G9R3M7_9MICO|nr:precorrin-2 C(20)-methyltransferase [Phycicoccus endophyticus]NHI18017.1 precorrin-2 C(20)-methyltransferase [Phycicoccus endophyticus]QNN50202.1 precorrin-2 C(20)-methyltransferase [Phycicoccus endophyticus]GGL27075.1 precorrin-3B C(17)-methyltransferase [Phycicoccus endophyticus]